jgi:sec-independent protein translocase protein TatC
MIKMTKEAENRVKGEMSLLEHLDELRRRLRIAIIALLIGSIIGAAIAEPAIDRITQPAREAGIILQAIKPSEKLSAFFKVSLIIGTALAMPMIVYQIFAYAAPGLEQKEKQYILLGVPFASLSFAAGAIFAGGVALPRALPFLVSFLQTIEDRWTVEFYLTFAGNIMLWSGLVFQTPLVMYFLALLGVVDAKGFAKARRFVVVGGAIGAALVTPTVDVVNMLLIMGPFLLLYEIGIILARFAQRTRR